MTGLTRSENDFQIQFENNLKTLKNKKKRNFSFLPPLLGFRPAGPTPPRPARPFSFLSLFLFLAKAQPNALLFSPSPSPLTGPAHPEIENHQHPSLLL
jgi:hypothetical protein